MKYMAGILCAVMASVAVSVLALSFATPVMAEDAANVEVIMKVLDSANAHVREDITELQELRVTLPLGTDLYYASALEEYALAKEALESGNPDFAKGHAMKAMKLFRTVTDLLSNVQELRRSTVIVVPVNEKLALLEKRADRLETVASASDVPVSFSEYHSAIVASKVALAQNDLEVAEEQLAFAKSILEDIQEDAQESAESRKEMKAKEFAQKMITRLSKMVTKQEKHNAMGDRDSLIEKLTEMINELKGTTEFDKIIELTQDSGRLHGMLHHYKALLADSEDSDEEKNDDAANDEQDDNDQSECGTSNSGTGSSDAAGCGTSNSGTGSSDDDEATKLKRTADELEDRANALLAESNSVLATTKIQDALVLISTARLNIDEGSYDAAKVALSSAKSALDEAEAMIQG